MAVAQRKATTVWTGDLAGGRGQLSFDSSGSAKDWPVTWASRTESAEGRTSPEELIAAAHAACFAMAFSHSLTQAGNKPDRLTVQATVSFDRVDGAMKVTRSELHVRGQVAGLDQAGFQAAAEKAEKGCPVSNALRGSVELSVQAELDR
jgi:osmotically inducible protein OsmC